MTQPADITAHGPGAAAPSAAAPLAAQPLAPADHSLGKRLGAARAARGLTLDEAGASLKIARRHLLAMEQDRWEDLPGPAWVVGFVRSYAAFLALDPQEAAAQARLLVRETRAARGGQRRGSRPRWVARWVGLTGSILMGAAAAGALAAGVIFGGLLPPPKAPPPQVAQAWFEPLEDPQGEHAPSGGDVVAQAAPPPATLPPSTPPQPPMSATGTSSAASAAMTPAAPAAMTPDASADPSSFASSPAPLQAASAVPPATAVPAAEPVSSGPNSPGPVSSGPASPPDATPALSPSPLTSPVPSPSEDALLALITGGGSSPRSPAAQPGDSGGLDDLLSSVVAGVEDMQDGMADALPTETLLADTLQAAVEAEETPASPPVSITDLAPLDPAPALPGGEDTGPGLATIQFNDALQPLEDVTDQVRAETVIAAPVETPAREPTLVLISFKAMEVTIRDADGGEVARETMTLGSSLSLPWQEGMTITAPDAGALSLYRDDIPLARLGQAGEAVENRPVPRE